MLSEWPCHGRHEVPFVHPYNSYADQLAENVAIFASLLSSIFLKSKLCISPFSVSSMGRDHSMSSSTGIRPTQQCSSPRLAVATVSKPPDIQSLWSWYGSVSRPWLGSRDSTPVRDERLHPVSEHERTSLKDIQTCQHCYRFCHWWLTWPTKPLLNLQNLQTILTLIKAGLRQPDWCQLVSEILLPI